ncbi:hypothetical protein [Gracilimonas sp. BCB1]|uniref:hypothetical protein n=1 Tax=Gracilimonas sp. BCB1 TaxID=3152362 RepID=UPI0032D8B5B0
MLNQNDYIMRQIHQLTQVLTRVISTLVGLKTQEKADQAIEISNKVLNEQLDLNISELLDMDSEEMLRVLEEHPGMNHENLERVADLFFELASVLSEEEEPNTNLSRLWKRALLVYEYIESEGNVYSIDRNHKIEKIQEILS